MNFGPGFFGHVGKRLDKKAKVNFKIYNTTGKQVISKQILPSISRRKSNQTMKFGQVMEYNIQNIFLETPYTKCEGNLFQSHF